MEDTSHRTEERFLLVKFTEEDDAVAVVPAEWVENGLCAWPPEKSSDKMQHLVKSSRKPAIGWKLFRCKKVRGYSTYEEARSKLPLAQVTSDLQSEAEQGRRRKGKQLCESDCSLSDEYSEAGELPPPPTPPQYEGTEGDSSSDLPESGQPSLDVCGREATQQRRDSRVITIPKTGLKMHPEASVRRQHKKYKASRGSEKGNQRITSSSRKKKTQRKEKAHRPSASHLPIERAVYELTVQQGHVTGASHSSNSQSDQLDTMSQSSHNSAVKDKLHHEILRLLHTIKLRQDQHTCQLDHLISLASLPRDMSCDTEAAVPESPYSSLEDLLEFDTTLKCDSTREKVKCLWSKFGGATAHDTTTRILTHLLTDDVAAKFSWQGAKGKLKFGELASWTALRDAVMANRSLRDTTAFEVERVVKSWLRHAKARAEKKESRVSSLSLCHLDPVEGNDP